MGRVAGHYGVRGWIRVERPEAALAACGQWWIGGEEYPVEDTKAHSGALLAKLGGIDSREAALKLKGSEVAVQRESLRVNVERLKHWQGKGAQLSPTAKRLVKLFAKKAA